MVNDLALLFERDINRLKTEMLAYTDPAKMWLNVSGINNPGGNLCLHLLGNTQYYIGTVLGNSGYIRNRPEEFSLKNIPVEELIVKIDAAQKIIVETIRSLDISVLENEYPEKVLGYEMTTRYFLLHLLAHFSYHLGQINYHRRITG